MKTFKPFRVVLSIILALALLTATGSSLVSAGFQFLHATDEQESSAPNVLNTFYVWKVNKPDDAVDGTCNSTHCSLREAVLYASNGDTITFDESLLGSTIKLGGHIWINKSLTIVGPGADQLTISGNEITHYSYTPEGGSVGGVFWVQGAYGTDGVEVISVSISGLTIQDGRAREGGAIYNHSRSTLVLSDCVIGPNNQAIESGGGISNKFGTLTLNRCTIWGNSQISQSGYDIIGGGGIATVNSPAVTMLINSTVSGNDADANGGGILAWAGGVAHLVHTTVTENIANQDFATVPQGGGGGIYLWISTVSLQNSIVAGNTDKTAPTDHTPHPDVSGVFSSLGGNLIGVSTGSTNTWATTDQIGLATTPIDPMLDELFKNNPGRTLTHALMVESPAIDEAECLAEVTLDQRGVSRPQGSACDIGAFELGALPATLTILPSTIPPGEVGSAYEQLFSVIGINQPVTWSWDDGPSNLDESCDFPWETPSRLICYANPALLLPVGSYTFTINVEEVGGTLTGSRDYTLIINPKLEFTPAKLPIARVGEAYNQVITVSGGKPSYTLTHLSGNLPSGLVFDPSTGAFTGTPTVAGTFNNIVIRAVDADGVTKSKIYSLIVLPEHLFSWSPVEPMSGITTTFTAISGLDYYEWSFGTELETGCPTSFGDGQTKTKTFSGKGLYKICLKATEDHPHQVVTDEQVITVTNTPPKINGISIDPKTSFPRQPVQATVYFLDRDGGVNFTCTIDWGDDTIEPGSVDAENGSCVFPPHAYSAVGSYVVTFEVRDDENADGTDSTTHEVIYLFAESADTWLASNVLPTTITLYGYAPLGTETMQFNIVGNPTHGSLNLSTISPLGCRPDHYRPAAECRATIVFTPTPHDPPIVGPDSFTYTVQDVAEHISTPPTPVNLWLDDNQKPVAEVGSASVLSNKPISLTIFGSDSDQNEDGDLDRLSFHIDTPPSQGKLSFDGDADIYDWLSPGARWYQTLIYTPNAGTVAGTDSFTFYVNDTHQDSTSETVTLDIYTPTTLHVNVNDDVVDASGCNFTHCSLREAVRDAIMGDTIDFALALPNTITLTRDSGGELVIDKSIQILGPGADQLTISAGFMDTGMDPRTGFRVIRLYVEEWPIEVEISGLTIRDGRASEGGGLYVGDEVTLTMTDCVVGPNNIVAVAGGGITSYGKKLTLNNCTVIGNHGTGTEGGAGIYVNRSDLIITNSTITGNVTNNLGGGILADNGSNVTLIHSTVSGNTSNLDSAEFARGGGGGIYNNGAKKVELWNTIVAGNTDLTDPTDQAGHAKWPDVYGMVTSLGGNLIGDSTGSTGWVLSDLVGIDPMLGTLDVHDPGTTPTFPLLSGSPAIDAVACAEGVDTDQRGVLRPQGELCDIGAFELEQEPSSFDIFLPMIRR